MEQLGDLEEGPYQRVSRVARMSPTGKGEPLAGRTTSQQSQLAAVQHVSHYWNVILENPHITNKEARANLARRGLRHVRGVLTRSILASRNEIGKVRLGGHRRKLDSAQMVPARPPEAEAQPAAPSEEVDDGGAMRISHDSMVPPILVGYQARSGVVTPDL